MVLACRSVERGLALQRAIEADAAANGHADPSIQVMHLDLSSLASVRSFSAAWAATGQPCHILINNAGIFSMSAPRCETVQGFESHLGTNHLGHFLLTLLLMPSLKQGALSLGRPARVVNVTSRLHLMTKWRRDDPNMTTGYTSLMAYAQSKLAQVAFAAELTHRGGGSVISVAVHPGEAVSDVVRSLPQFIQKLYGVVMGAILLTPAQGARSSVYCATSPEVERSTSSSSSSSTSSLAFYYDSNCAPGTSTPEMYDPETVAAIWKWSVEAVKLLPGEEDLPPPPPKA